MRRGFGLAPGNVRLLDLKSQDEALRTLAQLTRRATVDPYLRNTALKIIRDCASREDECELEAIYNAVKYGDKEIPALRNGIKYVADPRYADYFASPVDTLKNAERGANGGDCLPGETLVLGAGYKFVAIADVKPGDVIMGDGRWVRVTAAWDKGRQALLEFDLNNGCVLRCTAEHKLFVVPKVRDGAGDRREAQEVRAGDIRLGDDLLVPERLPFGSEALDDGRAFLLGLHVAEGWVDYSRADGRPLRVGISGLDGYRKEENKHRVVEICDRLGLTTRWNEKYVAINDEEIAQWLAGCGRRAPNKHVPSLDFVEPTVRQILLGLAADADVRNGVFSTTSSLLAMQYRIMLRMNGQSAHFARVDNHGGLGKNPIYRVTPRAVDDNRRRFARVRAIADGGEDQTYDIEVEGHRFYLPETDLLVHNCDDHSSLNAALAGALGWKVGLRAWGPKGAGGFSHVYPVVAFPKRARLVHINGQAMGAFDRVFGMDTTVDDAQVGWEPPKGEVLTAWLD